MSSSSELLDGLNPRQLEAVTHSGGPCLVLAGAGSGKTRVITHRIAWLIREADVPAAAICAVTFTNRAASEMRERVHSLLGDAPEALWVLTFHALGLRILRDAVGRPGAPRPGFAIYDRNDALRVWREAQKEARIDAAEYPPQQLFEACSRAVNRLEDPGGWDAPGQPYDQRLAARVYPGYRGRLRERNAVDFDDLLLLPLRLLRADAAIREGIHRRFAHLLIDEYQDTNRLQYRLVRALLSPSAELMVVGDEDQSIYRWRGAELANVLEFQRDFPGARVIRLEQNYRSTSPILAAAGALVARNRERLGKELWTDHEGGERPSFMLTASERDEAIWVAKQLGARRKLGIPFGEMAILYRTNAQSRPFEEELSSRGVPFRVVGGQTFFRRAEVKDLLSWTRLLVAGDDLALARAAATPSRGVGPKSLAALADGSDGSGAGWLFDQDPVGLGEKLRERGVVGRGVSGLVEIHRIVSALRERLGSSSLPDLLEEVLASSGYARMLRGQKDGEERLANLDELVASAAELEGDTPADAEVVTAFLDRVALVSDADTDRGGDRGVSLMSVHAAKGLEFETVFLAGLEEGLLPHATSVREGQVEEERRLCYVAMTRARRRLFLSAARLRRVQGQERLQRVSRFVEEIPGELIEREEDPGAVAARAARTASSTRRYRENVSGWRDRRRQSGSPPSRTAAKGASAPVPRAGRGSGVPAPHEELVPGATVFHPMFGPGRVTGREGEGPKLKITVSFARAGNKQLLARFAKLERLREPS